MRLNRFVALVFLPGAALAQAPAPLPDDQAALKAHVMFLASDAMRGREAGSPEFDIAAQYVAAQFFAAGLAPAGDADDKGVRGYLQQVPLVTYRSADEGDFVWTPRGGAAEKLAFRTDYVPAPDPGKAEVSVSGGMVFVGYGVRAPQYRQDDFKGVDVRGKVVAFVAGAPAAFSGEERAFFGSPTTKAKEAAAHGAVATIQLADPRGTADDPRRGGAYGVPRTTWALADGTGHREAPIQSLGTLQVAGAAKLFGAGWRAVVDEAGKPAPHYRSAALPGALTAVTRTRFARGASSNVAGMIPGSDPAVGKEVVVLSAHLDHIGVSASGPNDPPTRDRINNGALDDAVGIASLIEEAKRFKASGRAPKRSILFLAVTGEEKGLIGSGYFADHPTVPAKDLAADVNLDMPILFYQFRDLVAFGAERSTLGPIVSRAAAGMGLALAADPIPEQGIFVRSDHFRFVAKGIPSLFLWPGPANGGLEATKAFLAGCYHHPCDDISQPILWDQGVRFVDVNYRIAREIADGAERPVWNKADYFGTLYRGPMAQK